jgi:hypothetical protein
MKNLNFFKSSEFGHHFLELFNKGIVFLGLNFPLILEPYGIKQEPKFLLCRLFEGYKPG